MMNAVSSQEGRVANCLSNGEALIAEGNPESEKIRAKLDETHQLWDDLNELGHARQEVPSHFDNKIFLTSFAFFSDIKTGN